MIQEVYVDILLAVNFFVNLLLLSLVGGRAVLAAHLSAAAAGLGRDCVGNPAENRMERGDGADCLWLAGLVFANQAVAAFAGLRLGVLWADAAAARLVCWQGDVRL